MRLDINDLFIRQIWNIWKIKTRLCGICPYLTIYIYAPLAYTGVIIAGGVGVVCFEYLHFVAALDCIGYLKGRFDYSPNC